MKAFNLFGLAMAGTLFSSSPVFAQTTAPSKAAVPGVPIDPSNAAAPTASPGTPMPGQPGTTPPLVTPPGTVYPPATSAPAKKPQTRKRATKASRP